MKKLAEVISEAVVTALEKKGMIGKCSSGTERPKKTAYQKTETLLYNYTKFTKLVEDKRREIEELCKYGVPQRSKSIVEYTPGSGGVQGTVLPEESVERAVRSVEQSIVETVQAIAMVDKGMESLRNDPYFELLEMLYFEGRTQEEIADHFGVSQPTISSNRSRLVRELAMQMFPSQVAEEMIH
jgi:RNA polymerase sigma factor (sigma-70 family)